MAGSANCLVVDDEPGVRRSLVRMLQAQGFPCFEAGTGREALDVLERIGSPPSSSPTCACPSSTASASSRPSGERYPDTSVIMLSGMSETTIAVDCLHRGAADFLSSRSP